MTPLSPRQLEIVELAKTRGRVDVDDLSETFNVTKQTIRRDLNELCDRGVLNRFHGGAVPPSGAINVAYEARRRSAPAEKGAIGAVAASLVPDGASILINIGTMRW